MYSLNYSIICLFLSFSQLITTTFPFSTGLKGVKSKDTVIPLSLNANGELQQGGGTSIYKSIWETSELCPNYLNSIPILSSHYLLSYSTIEKKTILKVIQVGENPLEDTSLMYSTTYNDYNLYKIITLDQSSGIFVSISQDVSNTTETAYIMTGQVTVKDNEYSIVFGSKVKYADIYSLNPMITTLSSVAFAISYYDDTKMASRYGVINSQTLDIALSDPYVYADNSNYTKVHSIAGLTSSTYLLTYYDNSEGYVEFSGPLHATLVSVTLNAGTSKYEYSVLSSNMFNNTLFRDYFNTASINENMVVVAYIDAIDSNVKASSIVVNKNNNLMLTSTVSITTGETLSTYSDGVSMDIDITTIPNTNNFMLLFNDVGNNGYMTYSLGRYSTDGELSKLYSNFILSDAIDEDSEYLWASINSNNIDQVSILSSVTDKSCSNNQKNYQVNLGLMERLSTPIGVAAPSAAGNAVVLNGEVTTGNNLKQGYRYYTNTIGTLIAGNNYIGQAAVDVNPLDYIVDSDTNTIVTKDSTVGIATSSNKMYIKSIV